jgi:hypothetical protein
MKPPKPKRIVEAHEIYGKIDLELYRSPSWRALSPTALRVWLCLRAACVEAGGRRNGRLRLTFAQLAAQGIRRSSIAPALAELVAVVLIAIVRPPGRIGARLPANEYRLTDLPTDGAEPTRGYRRFNPEDGSSGAFVAAFRCARAAAHAARVAALRRSATKIRWSDIDSTQNDTGAHSTQCGTGSSNEVAPVAVPNRHRFQCRSDTGGKTRSAP